MPRKKADRAAEEERRAKSARWRYLIRNPDFVNGLRELARLRDPQAPHFPLIEPHHLADPPVQAIGSEENAAFRQKWAMAYAPLEDVIRALAKDANTNLEQFAPLFVSADSPVVIETERQVFSPDGEAEPWPPSLVTGRAVYIRVDVTHPVDTLLPLIERELRAFVKGQDDRLASEPELKQTLSKISNSRRRLDRVEFQLQVFDQASEGRTFQTIARDLRRPESSVKSAYLRARQQIYGLSQAQAKPPRKKLLPIATFNWEEHVRSCTMCSAGSTAEEMCDKGLLYVDQDYVPQREALRGSGRTRSR